MREGTASSPGTAAIPEPSTYALFGLGTLGLMVWRKRKKWVDRLLKH